MISLVKVALSEEARARVRYLLEFGAFESVREVLESALWGIEGPALELSDIAWNAALSSGRSSPPTDGRRTAEEVSVLVRAIIAEKRSLEREEIDGNIPSAVYLGREASEHVELFVRAGVYSSPDEAVEAALTAAVELTPLYEEFGAG